MTVRRAYGLTVPPSYRLTVYQSYILHMAIHIRDATDRDAVALVPLLAEVNHPASEAEIATRMVRVLGAGDRVLVAEDGETIVGLLTFHVTPVLHRPTFVARITALVVLPHAQGKGVGRRLVETAEALAVAGGAARLELTSGAEREGAHRFYRRLGYEDKGIRFAKVLASSPLPKES